MNTPLGNSISSYTRKVSSRLLWVTVALSNVYVVLFVPPLAGLLDNDAKYVFETITSPSALANFFFGSYGLMFVGFLVVTVGAVKLATSGHPHRVWYGYIFSFVFFFIGLLFYIFEFLFPTCTGADFFCLPKYWMIGMILMALGGIIALIFTIVLFLVHSEVFLKFFILIELILIATTGTFIGYYAHYYFMFSDTKKAYFETLSYTDLIKQCQNLPSSFSLYTLQYKCWEKVFAMDPVGVDVCRALEGENLSSCWFTGLYHYRNESNGYGNMCTTLETTESRRQCWFHALAGGSEYGDRQGGRICADIDDGNFRQECWTELVKKRPPYICMPVQDTDLQQECLLTKDSFGQSYFQKNQDSTTVKRVCNDMQNQYGWAVSDESVGPEDDAVFRDCLAEARRLGISK